MSQSKLGRSLILGASLGCLMTMRAVAQTIAIPEMTPPIAPNLVTDPDPRTSFGAVDKAFCIGKYEVTNLEYAAFLNAVAPTGADSKGKHLFGLYDPAMGQIPSEGGISYTPPGPSTPPGTCYKPIPGREKYPVNYIRWYDALRYCNWLHNISGPPDQGGPNSLTETGAYTLNRFGPSDEDGIPKNGSKLDHPYNGPDYIQRNAGARWFLPSENEWYKAAYYDARPAPLGPPAGHYWNYPTTSNETPNSARAAPPLRANSANYNFPKEEGHLTEVGSYKSNDPNDPKKSTTSPCGAFDMAGNVIEWNEALIYSVPAVGEFRGLRGSWYLGNTNGMSYNVRSAPQPAPNYEQIAGYPWPRSVAIGFRVANDPNPPTVSTTFDAVDNFNKDNNSNPWSYRYATSVGVPTVLLPHFSTIADPANPAKPSVETFGTNIGTPHNVQVFRNNGPQPYHPNSFVTIPTTLLGMDPQGDVCSVRWTAKAKGVYSVNGKFEMIDTGGVNGAHRFLVLKNYETDHATNSVVPDTLGVTPNGSPISNPGIPMEINDTIDFMVTGAGAVSNKTVGLSATISKVAVP